ncbi:hypothetical protein CQ018_13960 [Arthrobacter sp. MYb227]|uniref:DUF58 domain-containing protein n=1 Tax=Arthrobacter sp. MYb227 TaxID=1848601 RepID=UPI000CFCB230|nr:DUF58 domain-containing protein [Arthrobacter sp. MYb227]PQZ91067.1 hypothetical protein CQ018_13960 [Arthrobacter sp. MYb227]
MSQLETGPAEFRESPHTARWAIDDEPATLRARIHLGFLTARGWGIFVSGILALVGAWMLGRRELMAIALFLIVVPLLAAFVLRFGSSSLAVSRTFNPNVATTGAGVRVRLTISHQGRSPGQLLLSDTLPQDFGHGPQFSYPTPHALISGDGSKSLYEYRLRLASRGIYAIGPVNAQVTDVFGLATRPSSVDRPSALVAMPIKEILEPGPMPGERGAHGEASANRRLTPDSFDVMTREYRDGDSIQRIHWPATARRGEIMVRQEDYRATPRALLILDRSRAAFLQQGVGAELGIDIPQYTAPSKQSSHRFEWAVQAALAIGAHLSNTGFGVEVLDQQARPINQISASGSETGEEVFVGPHAVEEMQGALAALGLEDSSNRIDQASPSSMSTAMRTRLRADGDRLVLFLGEIPLAAANMWIDAVGAQRKVMVFSIVHRPEHAQPIIDRFRQVGWSALAVSPKTSLADAWEEIGRSV